MAETEVDLGKTYDAIVVGSGSRGWNGGARSHDAWHAGPDA